MLAACWARRYACVSYARAGQDVQRVGDMMSIKASHISLGPRDGPSTKKWAFALQHYIATLVTSRYKINLFIATPSNALYSNNNDISNVGNLRF